MVLKPLLNLFVACRNNFNLYIMKQIIKIFACIAIIAMALSCSKDSSSSSSIIGTWYIQKIEVIDGTDTHVFTPKKQKDGNIELGKYEYPAIGLRWANGTLVFTEHTITCCCGTGRYEIENNILYLSDDGDATILSVQKNQLILSTQYSNINNFLYKYYYSR